MAGRILFLLLVLPGLVLLPAAPGRANTLPGDGACEQAAPAAGFVDVSDADAALAVNCAVRWEVLAGTSTTTFDPTGHVTRATLAVVTARTLEAAGATMPEVGDLFDDVEGPFRDQIESLARVGIVEEVDTRSFAPERPATRAEVAAVFARAQAWLDGVGFEVEGDRFRDDDGLAQEAAIDGLAAAGIVTGFGDGEFRPAAGISRVQAALYVGRWLAYLADAELLDAAVPTTAPAQPAPTPAPTPTPAPAPAPPPIAGANAGVVVAPGSSAQGMEGCSSTACRYLVVTGVGFLPAAEVTVRCQVRGDDGWRNFASVGAVVDDQGRVSVADCYFGFPGRQVRGVIAGVASSPITWTWS